MLNHHLIARTAPKASPKNMVCFGNIRITVLTSSLFRVEQSEPQLFCDEATQVVWFRNLPAVPFEVTAAEEECRVKTKDVTLIVRKNIWESSIIFQQGEEILITDEDNLLGTYRTLDCCDGNFFSDGREKGHAIALEKGVLSRNGVAVYDDSNSLILRGDGEVVPRTQPERDIYIFAYGRRYRDAVKGLYRICGMPPKIPRFALGNWWSRYWAYTQQEYLDLMDSFTDSRLPFTVATVDMDWHPSENLPNGEDGWTGYTWNTELFPDYKGFLRDLHQRGLHVTLNLHPALGVRRFESQYQEMAAHMGFNPESGEPIAFDMADEKFINAYFSVLHKPYEADGVDFWWIDWQQGNSSRLSGLDPLWSLNHYHSLDIAQNKEQLILSRYSGAGSHRYPVGFSGDTRVTWETLQFLPYFTATASNIGYTWWSHDIGGHMDGITDGELFTRFIQFGVFSPINRLHSSKIRTFSKDTRSYHNGCGLIAAEFLRLRHKMLPFLYTAACETAEDGLALIEPMYYEYADEEDAYACPGQYLFGRQMIAAPVTEKSDGSGWVTKPVWLPVGKWTDIFTGDMYQGGGWQNITRPLDSFPLLAKEGGFFALDGRRNADNSIELPDVIRVLVFRGSGKYILKEDCGKSRAETCFLSEQISENEQQIKILQSDPDGILPAGDVVLELRGILEGEIDVDFAGKDSGFSSTARRDTLGTVLTLHGARSCSRCVITVKEKADLHRKKEAAIERILSGAEGINAEKQAVYSALCKAETADAYVRAAEASSLSVVFQKRLTELVSALYGHADVTPAPAPGR